MIKQKALELLKIAVNDADAQFRNGQWEAIDALVNHRQKMLVVQRTGWGKSSVYFISTRSLRDRGAGPTVIISPLLALIRNQILQAERLDLRAETVNSTNTDEWDEIYQRVLADEIDVLLISPERLSNENFLNRLLRPIADRIGLMVVDEAHCISDWGHDFRPDYRRLVNILSQMPPNMPVLGTTATANDRVVQDVRRQIGEIAIQRGTLVRDSLCLQTLRLADQASRLAWLAQNIPELPGTGIVYVLTKRDAEQVSAWLNQHEIVASAYHASIEHDDFADSNLYRQYLESLLLNNKIKVLVATTALSMGYDKPDIGFVIHYQAAGSVVAYYQQVGRAGRAIERAYGVLLSGKEDDDIHAFFRRSAFLPERQVDAILHALEENDGLSTYGLQERLNLRMGQINKVLKLLSVENPAPIIKLGSKWFKTPVDFRMDHERIEHLTHQRELEWRELNDYIDSETCLMAYLRDALDDPESEDCGQCAVCLGSPIVPEAVNKGLTILAKQFLRHAELPIVRKIQVASGAFLHYGFRGNLPAELRAEEGRVLSRWGDSGWGEWVKEDKQGGRFRDELVEAVAQMYEDRWRLIPQPQWVTCVPSIKHPLLVPGFAQRLAARLRLPFVDVIHKVRDNEPQRNQQNRFHQCSNLDGAFQVTDGIPQTPVLLADDIIDSGWTLTVLAALLRRAGSGPVYPVALASTSTGG